MIASEFDNIDTDIANSDIRAALPEKTFLEKVFLLHELFVTNRCQKADRKSRHLYDIEQMMDKDFAQRAIKDDVLWNSINRHRARFSSIHGVDYTPVLKGRLGCSPRKGSKEQCKCKTKKKLTNTMSILQYSTIRTNCANR